MEVANDSTFDENSKKAAQHLRTAAGIFEYVETRELPRWLDTPSDRPFELSFKVCRALSLYCCGNAQTLTIKKGLVARNSHLVLAKLAIDVWKKIEEAYLIMKGEKDWKEVNTSFKNLLQVHSVLSKAMAFKYMGESARDDENLGLAVSYLKIASESLRSVWSASPGAPLAKYSKEIDESRDDIEHQKRTFINDNDHIYFQKEVAPNVLEVFEAKSLMTPLAWVPPQPKYSQLFA